MADDSLAYEIFWTKDEVENDVAYSGHKTRIRKPLSAMQAQPEKSQKKIHDDDRYQKPEKDVPVPEKNKEKKSRHLEKSPKVKEKPSLKDLKPEDKKRVANLIRELAKAGEEKEVALEQLQVERLEFEHKMEGLHHQMEQITQDREIVQTQYLECQRLLNNYQKQLAEEQEKTSRMDHLINSSPMRTKRPSPMKAGRELRSSNHQRNSPRRQQTSPAHHMAPQQIHHHQPALNGYPPPISQPNLPPQVNGYQPLQFYNHSVPQIQNGIPDHRNGMFQGGFDVDSQNGGVDFQPPLSSTRRPSQNHHIRQQQNRQYGIAPDVHRKLTVTHDMPSRSSPDFPLSGQSRTASGEFQPLVPEPDVDSESSYPLQEQFDFKPMVADARTSRTPSDIGQDDQIKHRQEELFKQRFQLEQEHAWLQQKLAEQEDLLEQKQAQLTETELLYLKSGDLKGDPYTFPGLPKHRNFDPPPVQRHPDPPTIQIHTDPPPIQRHPEPPPIQRHPYGVLPTPKDRHISTNFPPEEFDELGQSKFLSGSMYELRQAHRSRHPSNGSGDWSSASSISGTPRNKGRRRSRDGKKHSHRRRSIEERTPIKSSDSPGYHSYSDGYVSFHSASKSKRKHAGSVSSSPSTTSTSTKSSHRHHRKLKNTSTSPLYRDVSAGTSPLLSPGRMQVTKAPVIYEDIYHRSPSTTSHHKSSRLRGNLSLHSNQHRESPSRPVLAPNRDTLQLTDLIDSLDAAAISRSPYKPLNRTHGSPVDRLTRSIHRTTPELFTPELFPLQDGSDTEMDMQESKMLEEVFFVL